MAGELRAADLLREWRSGKFRPAYYILGDEHAAKIEAVNLLKAQLKPDPFNVSEFASDADERAGAVVSDCTTGPVFSDRRLVIVSVPKVPQRLREAVQGYLENPLDSTILVLVSEESQPAKEDALARAFAARGAVCVFSAPSEVESVERLKTEARKAGKELEHEAAEALVAEAGAAWGMLKQELDKALLLAAGSPAVGLEHVVTSLGYRKESDPFTLSNLVEQRSLTPAVEHLRRMYEAGKKDDASFQALRQITGAVLKQYRAAKLASLGVPGDQAAKTLRISPKAWPFVMRSAGRYTPRRLLRDLKLCFRAENDLKSKAWLDPRLELEKLLADICRG